MMVWYYTIESSDHMIKNIATLQYGCNVLYGDHITQKYFFGAQTATICLGIVTNKFENEKKEISRSACVHVAQPHDTYEQI